MYLGIFDEIPYLGNVWGRPKVVKSTDENVSKLVFTKDDAVAEAVLYKYPTYEERTVICCSTQSGCPVGCRFCGSGEFFIRNLTSMEIYDQVKACLDIAFYEGGTLYSDMDKLQVMFMSMGEPMLNWEELEEALRLINAAWPRAKLLISTMGPMVPARVWDELIKLSVEIPEIGLQFSVHEATEEARDKLIPIHKKLTLPQIGQLGLDWGDATGRRPFFNYCVHDENNGDYAVNQLLKYFPPAVWECTLSVICEADEGVAAANQRQRSLVEDFMQKMLQVGYSVRMFDPAGQDDIGGGCGQLWYVQDWAKNHPELTHKTHGTGKDRVHAPK